MLKTRKHIQLTGATVTIGLAFIVLRANAAVHTRRSTSASMVRDPRVYVHQTSRVAELNCRDVTDDCQVELPGFDLSAIGATIGAREQSKSQCQARSSRSRPALPCCRRRSGKTVASPQRQHRRTIMSCPAAIRERVSPVSLGRSGRLARNWKNHPWRARSTAVYRPL
jgi:hypothetical protein